MRRIPSVKREKKKKTLKIESIGKGAIEKGTSQKGGVEREHLKEKRDGI